MSKSEKAGIKRVPKYFVHKIALLYKMLMSKKGPNFSWIIVELCYPDILVTMSCMAKCLCRKRGIILSNIYRILQKVNQVSYIMCPKCMPDIRRLAHELFQIFCSQGCFSFQDAKVGKSREMIQSNRYRGSYTSGHFIWNLWNEPSESFINFIRNDHESVKKILFIIWPF